MSKQRSLVAPFPEYGERVNTAMRKKGTDAFVLAGKCQVQKRTVDTWIKGERRPNREQEVALADALAVSLDWLAGREKPKLKRR